MFFKVYFRLGLVSITLKSLLNRPMMGNLYYQLKECFCDSYVEWRIYVVDL